MAHILCSQTDRQTTDRYYVKYFKRIGHWFHRTVYLYTKLHGVTLMFTEISFLPCSFRSNNLRPLTSSHDERTERQGAVLCCHVMSLSRDCVSFNYCLTPPYNLHIFLHMFSLDLFLSPLDMCPPPGWSCDVSVAGRDGELATAPQ